MLAMTIKPADQIDAASARDAGMLAAVDEGLSDVKAGRSVPYDKVRRWLLSWGSKKELPPP
jgi:predicted transcriptional regulator